ncbi:hypothetical protein GCM10018790_75880 [Kitasatospora xanthocidica]|nr:hypothetical protein GCM10018790_75880 [Kitasatospora xanthocidica]
MARTETPGWPGPAGRATGGTGAADGAPVVRRARAPGVARAARTASPSRHCYPGIPWTGGIKTPRTSRTGDPSSEVHPTRPRRPANPEPPAHVTFDKRPTGAPSWHSPIPARQRTAAP